MKYSLLVDILVKYIWVATFGLFGLNGFRLCSNHIKSGKDFTKYCTYLDGCEWVDC
jgi:hypothetical protein